MRIDLNPKDTWFPLSELYRAELARKLPAFAEPGLQAQIYMGYAHAVWESTQSLAKLFSHKKTIAIAAPAGDLIFEPIAKAFSEEGYTLKLLTPAEIEDPKSWLEPVLTDLLFVLWSVDDPITGRLENREALTAALKDKRVFRILLSHVAFRAQAVERPSPFEARIWSLTPQRALFTGGERCRIQPSVARILPWPEGSAGEIAEELKSNEDGLDRVLAFESNLCEGFKPYFKPTASRVFDRAVIVGPEFDGSAIIDELAKRGVGAVAPAGVDGPLESTSPCRWENPRIKDWLLARGESEDTVRGLVVISASNLNNETAEILADVARDLRKRQQG